MHYYACMLLLWTGTRSNEGKIATKVKSISPFTIAHEYCSLPFNHILLIEPLMSSKQHYCYVTKTIFSTETARWLEHWSIGVSPAARSPNISMDTRYGVWLHLGCSHNSQPPYLWRAHYEMVIHIEHVHIGSFALGRIFMDDAGPGISRFSRNTCKEDWENRLSENKTCAARRAARVETFRASD